MLPQIMWFAELVGTIAFAVSGTLVAVERRMDVFGAFVLGVTTAVGGGILRDLILGITPPYVFRTSFYVTASIVTVALFSLLFFALKRCHKLYVGSKFRNLLFFSDCIGLGIFSVVGVNAAIQAGFGENLFLLVFVGTITGVGGGIMRDMMAGYIPVVLRKRVYAVAAIAGCWLYAVLQLVIPNVVAMAVGAITVFTIRILAMQFKWNLPVLSRDDSF